VGRYRDRARHLFYRRLLNGLMLWLTGIVSDALELGFHVANFTSAFLGAFVVSLVSFALSLFVASEQST
jgi:uncharacterized membrane protein YvlD (DUF360 family)